MATKIIYKLVDEKGKNRYCLEKAESAQDKKFGKVMHEYKTGNLKSGSGAKVASREQALAIAGKESGKYMKTTKKLNLKDKVIAYLTKHPKPKDEKEFHKFAEKISEKHGMAEETAYEILGNLLSGGKSKGKIEKVDPKELAMGIKVELEHTKDKRIAEKIARDHLLEVKDYYTRLKKMEKEAEMSKARQTKYVRRVPKAGGGYRYFYKDAKKEKIKEEKGENLPKDLTKLSKEQHEKSINFLSKLSIKELRKRQDLLQKQQQVAYKEKKENSFKNLSIMEEHLNAAIDIKEFGDSTAKEWSKFIYEKNNSKLEKAKILPIGSIATWGDGKKYRKVSQNNWEPVDKSEKKRGHIPSAGASGDISTPSKLHDKFMTFLGNMDKDKKNLFLGGKMNFGKKQFIAPSGKIALQWTKGNIKIVKVDDMQKAKKVPVGTVSGQHEKVAEGKWVKKTGNKETKGEKIENKKNGKEKEQTESSSKKEKIKSALKKIASILSDALSGQDVVPETGRTIEDVGEKIKQKNK